MVMPQHFKIKITERQRRKYNKDGVMELWAKCVDRFGPPGWQGGDRWVFDSYKTFYFRNQADAVLFVLIQS